MNVCTWKLQSFPRYGVTAVMIVPCWPGSSFFSVFWPDGKHAAGFVSKMVLFSPFYICGPLVTTTALRGKKSFTTAALRVDFSRQCSVSTRRRKIFCLAGGCDDCY